MSKCLFCETDVAQKDGKRARLFCNGNCRNKYYYKINAANKPKKKAGRPKKDAALKFPHLYVPKAEVGTEKPKVTWLPPHSKIGSEDTQAEIDKHKADLAYLTKISSPTTLTKKSIAFAERKIAELQKQLP